MGFPENVLAPGERVERSLHPHWLTMAGPVGLGLLAVIAGATGLWFTASRDAPGAVRWIIVAAMVLVLVPVVVVPYLTWRTTHYVITSHRVMVRKGILNKTGKDITLSKITDVSFRQTLLDRFIRAGTLNIESAGDSPDETLRYIPRSNEMQQLINRLIDEDDRRRRRMDHYGADPSGPADPSDGSQPPARRG